MPAIALSIDFAVSASRSQTPPVHVSVHQFGNETRLTLSQASSLVSLPVEDAKRLVDAIVRAVDRG